MASFFTYKQYVKPNNTPLEKHSSIKYLSSLRIKTPARGGLSLAWLEVHMSWYTYLRPAIIFSTASGLSKVLVSPRLLVSPSATFRRIRRIILPERVLGRSSTT